MPSKIQSRPKLLMIQFIQQTRKNPQFKFRLRGDVEDAKKFVHRMRVELSRMRDTVKASGRSPKRFSVLTEMLDFDPVEGITVVTLRKSEGEDIQISAEVDAIFADIAIEDKA